MRALPVFLLRAQQQAVDGDAGVVDEHVEPPVIGGDLLDRRVDRGGVGDVEARQRARPAGVRDLLQRLDGGRLVRRVVDDHEEPVGAERDGDRPTDAARSARDERDPSRFSH